MREDPPAVLVAVALEVRGDELREMEDGMCLEDDDIDDTTSVPLFVTFDVDNDLAVFHALDGVREPDVLEPDDVCATTIAAPRKAATMLRCTCISLHEMDVHYRDIQFGRDELYMFLAHIHA